MTPIKTYALAVLSGTLLAAAQPALAQDEAAPATVSENGTTFRGIRIEGNLGGDRFQSEGNHNDKFGYGGTVGFDGTYGEKLLVGAEGSYWRANNWNENCTGLADGNSICHKAFEEWGAAVRVGYLPTPQFLIFGKAGYVNGEQRKRIDGPAGNQLVYDHYRADGYQVGGGLEYSMSPTSPFYVNAQYVYSQYHGHSSRQRLMAGFGVRFK